MRIRKAEVAVPLRHDSRTIETIIKLHIIKLNVSTVTEDSTSFPVITCGCIANRQPINEYLLIALPVCENMTQPLIRFSFASQDGFIRPVYAFIRRRFCSCKSAL